MLKQIARVPKLLRASCGIHRWTSRIGWQEIPGRCGALKDFRHESVFANPTRRFFQNGSVQKKRISRVVSNIVTQHTSFTLVNPAARTLAASYGHLGFRSVATLAAVASPKVVLSCLGDLDYRERRVRESFFVGAVNRLRISNDRRSLR